MLIDASAPVSARGSRLLSSTCPLLEMARCMAPLRVSSRIKAPSLVLTAKGRPGGTSGASSPFDAATFGPTRCPDRSPLDGEASPGAEDDGPPLTGSTPGLAWSRPKPKTRPATAAPPARTPPPISQGGPSRRTKARDVAVVVVVPASGTALGLSLAFDCEPEESEGSGPRSSDRPSPARSPPAAGATSTGRAGVDGAVSPEAGDGAGGG